MGCMIDALVAIGAFAGYWARRSATRLSRLPDLPMALESLIAVGGGLMLVSRF